MSMLLPQPVSKYNSDHVTLLITLQCPSISQSVKATLLTMTLKALCRTPFPLQTYRLLLSLLLSWVISLEYGHHSPISEPLNLLFPLPSMLFHLISPQFYSLISFRSSLVTSSERPTLSAPFRTLTAGFSFSFS